MKQNSDIEIQEWLDAFDNILQLDGPSRAKEILHHLHQKIDRPSPYGNGTLNTAYKNTIPLEEQAQYPGDLELDKKIETIVRWNAIAMVLKANKESDGIGGHISSFASSATLYEVAYNHIYQGHTDNFNGDVVFFQGHITPGIYSRAYLEGILTEEHICNFRRELKQNKNSIEQGIPSYPHPRLMPDFWQYPTVSMGIGPIVSIYLARFNKYLHHRNLKNTEDTTVFSYLGDGEMDEVDSLGAINIASREKLDNLVWIVNCNLQRLDGPVTGNSKVIQDLERIFIGANWNVIKVVLGSEWDDLLKEDTNGSLQKILNETVDGEFQNIFVSNGKEKRERFFNQYEEVKEMVKNLSDEEIGNMKWGGHDNQKVYAAYHKAKELKNGRPTVILAKTVKGFGMGESGEGKNIAHQQKKMTEDSLLQFAERFNLPLTEKEVKELKFYLPSKNSAEMKYLKEIRKQRNGFLPYRNENKAPMPKFPQDKLYESFFQGTKGREVSTTMAFVQVLSNLLKDKEFGKHVVPIVPDESRTFGMEALFRQYGIYSINGQVYEPVDGKSLVPYKEKKDGQILQEGINEAGALSSFIAAGTSYCHQNIRMLPFYIFYSMFGFQRIGDLVWAACDSKAKGFLLGGTAGRTTLNGEGLQHEDGHSQILAATFPNLQSYDPAFGYEIAAIIKHGIHEMLKENKDILYYITLYNENYAQEEIPTGITEEQINKGLYVYKESDKKLKNHVNLMTSGVTILAIKKASEILKNYDVSTTIWSAPSFKKLRDDAVQCERWNILNPTKKQKVSYLEATLQEKKVQDGYFIACTDYMRLYPEMIARWMPKTFLTLGTDGFGRSSSREELRKFFNVNAENIVLATLSLLAKEKKIDKKILDKAIKDLKIESDFLSPIEFDYF